MRRIHPFFSAENIVLYKNLVTGIVNFNFSLLILGSKLINLSCESVKKVSFFPRLLCWSYAWECWFGSIVVSRDNRGAPIGPNSN